MRRRTVLIVPATVPGPKVTRLCRRQTDVPVPVCAAPSSVPSAETHRVLPEQVTVEQVDQLREENRLLRAEIERVRSDHATA